MDALFLFRCFGHMMDVREAGAGWTLDRQHHPCTSLGRLFYLAIMLDERSRRIFGGAIAHRLRRALLLDALDMTLAQHRPQSIIHLSDSGRQYTSYAFDKHCPNACVVPSMGSTGNAYEYAKAERFSPAREREVIDR